MSRLWAWFPPHLIGTIEQTEDDLSFTYSEDWLDYDKSFNLSYSLPRSQKIYKKEAAAFFGNLLPEGGARDALCRKFGISIDNDFELLARIGEDCAGAFIITTHSKPPMNASDCPFLVRGPFCCARVSRPRTPADRRSPHL